MRCKVTNIGCVSGFSADGKCWNKIVFILPFRASDSVDCVGLNSIHAFVKPDDLSDFPSGKEVEADVYYFAKDGRYVVKKAR